MSTKFAPITQKLLNSYPMWSSIRNDEQSNGAQFLNTIGLQLEDLHEQLINIEKNYTIPFANVTDIDILYKFQLPKTYQFTIANNDTTNPIYSPPTVAGTIGSSVYTVGLSQFNDVESFWYDSIPTRINTASFPVTNIVTDLASVNMYGVIASITESQSPYIANINLDQPYTRLWVQCVGGTQYIDIDQNSNVQRSSIVITGITRKGIQESETLIFLHDDLLPTMKEWQSISKLEIYNISPNTTNVRLLAHRFRRNQTPLLQPPRSFYNLYSSAESKQDMDIFWELGINGSGNSVAKLQTWDTDDIRVRMNGFISLDTLRSFELHNISNVAITTANDLAVEPFSNRIVVVDNTKLYLFDGDWTLPAMNIMDKKDVNVMSVMQTSTYHITPGDSFSIEYFWQRQITDPVRHRVWVQYPDGTLHNALAGSFSSYDSSAYLFNNPVDRFLRAKEQYVLTTVGDYIFNMEVVYSNGVKEIDQRIISVDSKKALTEFSFASIAPGGILRGVDFDSDHNIWILVDTSSTFTKIKVQLAYDIMMIDYQNKVIFFKEKYDQIRVTT
jgi:hypothetical protein